MVDNSIPQGLSMALAQDPNALQAFSALSPLARQDVITHARAITSKEEMQALVSTLSPS
ncbi:MAG: hypothetical protein PHD32_06685 [Eubacteriales bacterium]|nr:hypothetical protein [Eubacteriales bacterium]